MRLFNIRASVFGRSHIHNALMYVWQGGAEGANALADMLAGKISPCGKLPNTQLKTIEGLPFLQDFGSTGTIKYTEDIYVGYRYTETFDKDRVKFPFGYGITYTDFDLKYSVEENGDKITVKAEVKNIGSFASKEVVQIYFGAPCGKLGTPEKQLIDFKKTKELNPDESEVLEISFLKSQLSSYDDSGVTGNKHCYVMENGEYKIYAGTDVRSSREVLSFVLDETVVTEQLEEVMAPETPFDRIVAKEENGKRVISLEAAPLRETDLDERIISRRAEEIPYTGDRGIKLLDVYEGKNTIEEFVAQITDQDLTCLVCGEGMNSPKVTPGTGGAFGGVTDKLLEYGIPVCCVTDGPSGLRLADQHTATSMPNGYVFASCFDEPFIEELFTLEGVELFRCNIDALLGPGMNIHRHPLCGRNFEYFSEDPVLSGKVAAAQSRGLKKIGCTTTIKHFCGNNQELGRHYEDSVISVRALREIYLKGFRIAVEEGGATAIMTSYNLINGYHAASNYDLTTTVLRNEWGYTGMVMTDWWAKCNVKGDGGNTENLKAMVRAQNDVYMVCPSAENKPHNIIEGLNEGYIVRSDLQRTAMNLLRYIMNSPTFMKFVDGGCVIPEFAKLDETGMKLLATVESPVAEGEYEVEFGGDSDIIFVIELASHTADLAQSGVRIYIDSAPGIALAVEGTKGKFVTYKRQIKKPLATHKLTFKFEHMVEIKSVKIYG